MDFLNTEEIVNEEKIEQPVEKPKFSKKNKAICPIVSNIGNNKVIFIFDDFGLIADLEKFDSKNAKSVEIEYTGTIGKCNFEYEVKKCIK